MLNTTSYSPADDFDLNTSGEPCDPVMFPVALGLFTLLLKIWAAWRKLTLA